VTSYESTSQGRSREDVQWTATALYEKLFGSPGRDRGFPRRAWTGMGPLRAAQATVRPRLPGVGRASCGIPPTRKRARYEQPPPTTGSRAIPSCHEIIVHREEGGLGRIRHTDLLEDGSNLLLLECHEGLARFPHVDNANAVMSLRHAMKNDSRGWRATGRRPMISTTSSYCSSETSR